MDLVKIIGIAFITAVTTILLKPSKPELSVIITVVGAILIMILLIDGLKETVAAIKQFIVLSGVENGLLKAFLKIVGVGYIVEFSAGILNDFGSHSIADKVVLAGKIVIVVIALPIFQSLFSLVGEFLKLV